MKARFKGLFLLVLAFAMCFSLMSISAFANDATSQSSDSVTFKAAEVSDEDSVTFKVTNPSGDNIGLQLAIFQFTGTGIKLLDEGDSCEIGTGDSSLNLALGFKGANSTRNAIWSSNSDAISFGVKQEKNVDGTTYTYCPVSLSSTPVTGPIAITATLSGFTASVTLVKTVSIPGDAIAYVGNLEGGDFLKSVSALQEAIDNAAQNTTITLVKDVELTENFDGKNVTIQGNGRKFQVTSDVNIKISNLVVDMGNSSTCALEVAGSAVTPEDRGIVTLENAKITGNSSTHALVINGGDVTITGNETEISTPSDYTIDVSADPGKVSKLTIEAGNIGAIGDNVGIPGPYGSAEITVNGGTIQQIYVGYARDTVTVTGGTIATLIANNTLVYDDESKTKLTVSGGRIGTENIINVYKFATGIITGGYFKQDPTKYDQKQYVNTPYQAIALTEGDENYAEGYRYKVDCVYTVPSGLATYGQRLADVQLANPAGNPEGTWTWVDSTMSVGDAGERTFKANFTPTDSQYPSKSSVDVPVIVGKAPITPSVEIEGWTYGEAPKSSSVSGNTGNGAVTYDYAAKGSSDFSATVPTAAGEYTVRASVAATQNYEAGAATADFAIAKANAVPATVTASNRTFDGTEKPLVAVSGAATGGAMQYALGQDGTTAPATGYAPSIPTGTDAKTYYVWYKVAGDTNHNDAAPACVEVAIAPEAQGNVETDVVTDEGAPALSAANMDKVAEAVLTDIEKAEVASGAEAKIWLEDAALSEDNVPADDAAALRSTCTSLGLTPGAWLDISLRKQVGDGAVVAVHRSNVAVAFTLEVPKELRAAGRTFCLLRYHEGDVSELGRTTGDALEGESELFSTYLIAYSGGEQPQSKDASTSQSRDTEKAKQDSGQDKQNTKSSSNASSTPKTSDTISAIGWLICLVVNAIAVVYARFKLRTRKS